MTLHPKDKVTVKRGPLGGMKVILKRRDVANKCWHASVCVDGQPAESVMVWEYELVDVVERKSKSKGG